jgi:hypothetical protein
MIEDLALIFRRFNIKKFHQLSDVKAIELQVGIHDAS